jgi:ABC-2 type transport system ATP-binding protein
MTLPEPSRGATVIDAQGLTKKFGDFTAVEDVSFTIHAGEVVGYLGPNGSGKTTTIRMLLGLLRPTSGKAQVLGFDTVRQAEPLRQLVGYMSQKFGLYQELTVRENLAFYAGVYGVNQPERIKQVMEMVGLQTLVNERVDSLSAGWRQRLALATAIVHRPRLLFLDEPTSGVDPKTRRSFWDLIYAVVEQGVTALVTTHYMDEAEYCGRVGIMRDGRLLALDTPSNLKMNALPGAAWDVFAQPLLPALSALENSPLVLRAGLVGDHLRAIIPSQVEEAGLQAVLRQAGIEGATVERVEASLEDVFLSLAARSQR